MGGANALSFGQIAIVSYNFYQKFHENKTIGERNEPGVFIVPLWIRQCF